MTKGEANYTLPKTERLHSKKLIDELFAGGSKSMSSFPLRMVYRPKQSDGNEASACEMLISVPKRYLHRANKRNRVKRQVREAYRKNKHILDGSNIMMAFIWLDSKLYPSDIVEQNVTALLRRAAENLKA